MQLVLKLKESGKTKEFPQLIAIFAASTIFLSQGVLFAWSSPAIPQLINDSTIHITLEEASYFPAISASVMAISAPLFPQLMDVIGRRKSLLLTALPQLVAWFCALISTSTWHFYLSRVLSGIGDAAVYATVPVYIGEITQPYIRETWGNVPAICFCAGIFLVNLIGAYTSVKTMAWICVWIPIVIIPCIWFVPESPYYLLMKGEENGARKSLQILRSTTNVEQELKELQSNVQRQIAESGNIADLFTITSNRKALLICLLFRVAQIFSGIPAFSVFTQYTFQNVGGFSEKSSSVIYSGVFCLSYVISPFFIGKCGRRPLIMFSCLSCAIILSVLAVYFYFDQYCTHEIYLSWLPLTGMIVFLILGSPGLSALPTLILGELFPTNIKSKAVTLMNIAFALGCIIVPKLFQLLTTNIGIFSPFCLFAVSCYICTVLAYLYVIETKGKTLEEIQVLLKS